MRIEKIIVSIIQDDHKLYNIHQQCQCCGNTITPTAQPNGVSYYYVVGDDEDYGRAIDEKCLGMWLGKIGQDIADNPHPRWLHATIQTNTERRR